MKKIILFIMLGVLLGGLIVYGAIRYLAGQRVKDEIAGFVDKSPSIEKINYEKIRVGIIRPAVYLEKTHIKLTDYSEPILIDQIELMVQEQGHSIPFQARMEIRGIHVSSHHGILQPVGAELQAMGHDDISGTIILDYHYDPAEMRLDLNNVSLQVKGMGQLQFKLTLTHFNLSRLSTQGEEINIATLLMALPTAGIASGRIIYHDDSFIQLLSHLNLPRSDREQSVHWRQELTQMLMEEKNEQVRQNILVLREFIDHPGFITVTLDPATPVPLFRLLWVKDLIDLLALFNVQITT